MDSFYLAIIVFAFIIITCLLLLKTVPVILYYYGKEHVRGNDRLKMVYKYKGKNHLTFENLLPQNVPFPLTIDMIKAYTKQLNQEHPLYLTGIDEIVLAEREPGLDIKIFGRYTAYPKLKSRQGAVIHLFPLHQEGEFFRYYINDENGPYFLLTKEEAAQEMWFTLGHEIGHNIIYNLKKELHGIEVESQADLWSEKLGFASQEKEFLKGRTLYHNGEKIGPYRQEEFEEYLALGKEA